jgi:hypothetical protein
MKRSDPKTCVIVSKVEEGGKVIKNKKKVKGKEE